MRKVPSENRTADIPLVHVLIVIAIGVLVVRPIQGRRVV
jgi:hypothetical protein